jgi:hypothetical protein
MPVAFEPSGSRVPPGLAARTFIAHRDQVAGDVENSERLALDTTLADQLPGSRALRGGGSVHGQVSRGVGGGHEKADARVGLGSDRSQAARASSEDMNVPQESCQVKIFLSIRTSF